MSIYLDLNGVIAWNGKTIIIFRKLNASDNQQKFVKKKNVASEISMLMAPSLK